MAELCKKTTGCTTWSEKHHHAPDCLTAVENVIWSFQNPTSTPLCNWCLCEKIHTAECPDVNGALSTFVRASHKAGHKPHEIVLALAHHAPQNQYEPVQPAEKRAECPGCGSWNRYGYHAGVCRVARENATRFPGCPWCTRDKGTGHVAGCPNAGNPAYQAAPPENPLKSVLTVRKKAARWRTEPDQPSHDAQEGPQEAAGATQTVQDVSKAVQAPPNAPGGVYEVPCDVLDAVRDAWNTWRGTGTSGQRCSCSCSSCSDLEDRLRRLCDLTTFFVRKP